MVRATTGLEPVATNPLTRRLTVALRDRWCGGGGFAQLADELVDVVVDHIRTAGIGRHDVRIGEAIADALRDHAERDELAPTDDPHQLTLFDQVEGGAEPAAGDRVVAKWRDGRVVDVQRYDDAVRGLGGAR